MNLTPLRIAAVYLKTDKVRTKIFYGVIFLFSIILISKIFITPLQKRYVEQFHLKSESFSHWALFHLLPSMYSYENELCFLDYCIYVNHYPLRIFTFNPANRKSLYAFPEDHYARLRSRYQGVEVFSVYELQWANQHFYMKRLNNGAAEEYLR